MKRPRLLLLAIPAVALAVAALAADPKPVAPGGVGLTELPALGTPDTAVVLVRWGAVVDARGNPVARYLWQLRDLGLSATVAADSTTPPQVADTVRVPRALPGDSTIVQAAVAARDAKGKQSAWGMSARLVIPGRPWLPPPAPSVTVDTLAWTKADSLWVVVETGVLAYEPGTIGYGVRAGDTLDVCMYGWRGGVRTAAHVVHDFRSTVPIFTPVAGASSRGAHCRRLAIDRNATVGAIDNALRYAHTEQPSVVFRGGK